ncbi:MAG: phosphopantetheine-binding protein [Bacteroidales bacterium]|jgi:acyl carrier protein|nr:phosphopantetheine-binding protein [Bacteroidota bacterium]HOH24426.1 phosphopantetheine-binding protein [Bacteroidales bacterium]HOQ57661.1 phosphopantetheine-binding protein [Bacteroidales bacterium]HPB36000.1 phosphopantetheine-binding protein [Bacteroidales bacterium]HPL05681.1 phosphopantetheine-binding protein [Bacteroidales bacterium]
MTIEEIVEKATTILAEEFEVEESEITPEASLKETLGLDSLDLVDVVVLVEQHFGVTLKGQDFVGIKTFNDFYELLNRKING